MAEATNVFEPGTYSVRCTTVDRSDPSSPPKPLLIITPTDKGTYPVLLFFHGFWIENASYSQLLRHISSHGYVVIAPQLYTMMFTCGAAELGAAADVTCWLSSGGLNTILPEHVEPDLLNLALAGHGRGGKTAFALALGLANASLKFSLLLGLDPVEGTDPKILTHIPRSLDLEIPVVVIGTGLGDNHRYGVLPACAPDGRNHEAFFTECKPPCWYFYAKNYGHMDMIDYGKETLTSCVCVGGTAPRTPFRKCLAGIFVAILRAYLQGQTEDLQAIAKQPSIAPTQLDPVLYIEA